MTDFVLPVVPKPKKSRPKLTWNRFIQKYGIPASILVGALMIAGSIYISFGVPNQKAVQSRGVSQASPPPPPSPNPNPPVAGETTVAVSADDDAFLGKENAPIVVIEFSDFQCPFCRKMWRDTLPQLKKEYIDTGKVKFVYRDFPLDFHPGAMPAAQGADCAREEGQFWEMHDKIFGEQDKQGTGTIQFGIKEVKQWAAAIGLDTKKFNQCLDSGKYDGEVKDDLKDGQAAGVTGTPNTFVNGRKLNGALPYESFKSLIEEELNKQT